MEFKQTIRAAAAAVTFLMGTATAHADLVLPASEDNNVLRSAADTVQPNGTTFQTKHANTGQGNARLAFLKFDVTNASIADGPNAVFTATTTAGATTNFTLRAYALNAGVTGFGWTEDSITYNNRPAASTTNPLINLGDVTQAGVDVSLASGTGAGAKVSFDLPNWESFRQSDDTLSMILIVTAQVDNGPSLTFASSENATAASVPTLAIVPEPAVVGVLATGAVGLLLRRRRTRSRD